jgi:hypothetical protein
MRVKVASDRHNDKEQEEFAKAAKPHGDFLNREACCPSEYAPCGPRELQGRRVPAGNRGAVDQSVIDEGVVPIFSLFFSIRRLTLAVGATADAVPPVTLFVAEGDPTEGPPPSQPSVNSEPASRSLSARYLIASSFS